MAGRLSVQSGFRRKSVKKVERTRNLKRKAWLALFWLFVTYLIWRIWG